MPRSPQWSPSLWLPHQDPIHPFSSPIHATCPAHLILLDFITRTILGEEYKSFSSLLCNLLHSPVTLSLLGPNILLNTMFSNTLSFLSSRNVNNQGNYGHRRYNCQEFLILNHMVSTEPLTDKDKKFTSSYFNSKSVIFYTNLYNYTNIQTN